MRTIYLVTTVDLGRDALGDTVRAFATKEKADQLVADADAYDKTRPWPKDFPNDEAYEEFQGALKLWQKNAPIDNWLDYNNCYTVQEVQLEE